MTHLHVLLAVSLAFQALKQEEILRWSNSDQIKIICHIIHITYLHTYIQISIQYLELQTTRFQWMFGSTWFNNHFPFQVLESSPSKTVLFFKGRIGAVNWGCFFGHEICNCASVYVFYYTICSCFLFSETTKLTIRSFRRYLFYIMFLDLEVFQSISIYFPFWYTRWTCNFCFRRSVPFLHVFANHGSFNRVEKNLAHVRWETLLRNPGVVDIELNQALTVKIPCLKQVPHENQRLEDETSLWGWPIFRGLCLTSRHCIAGEPLGWFNPSVNGNRRFDLIKIWHDKD